MRFDTPPPPYSETSDSPQPHDDESPPQIRRAPITRTYTLNTGTSSGSDINTLTKHSLYIPENGRTEGINTALIIASKSQTQVVPPKISDFETLQITSTSTNIERTLSAPSAPLELRAPDAPPKLTSETPSEPSSTLSSSASSYVSRAFQEARHFAGGIIARPSESTRHFSILRHSHGLVFYQGCSTTLAISIFSDAPLPAGRQIWLQDKGYSGNTGMRLKAFVGNNGSWLNVTPAIPISPDQLDESDERAWQRDIRNFLKKARYPKHVLRETLVVRIPVEASDGYFHFVLCPSDKKKVLCPSPVFRVLSTSTSPSSLRGASLSTLPLELGALAMTAYANNTIGRIISPATSAAEKVAKPFLPSAAKKEAAVALYGKSGAGDMVRSTITNGNVQYKGVRSFSYNLARGEDCEAGPSPPYPICFVARSDVDARNADSFSVPSMRLSGIAEHIPHQLRGHYFAWARLRPAMWQKNVGTDLELWSQAVISSSPIRASDLTKATISEASQRIFKIHFISDDFDAQSYDGKHLDIKIMGFLRPDSPLDSSCGLEDELVAELNDIVFAQRVLGRPLFAPEGGGGSRGVLEIATTGYADVRLAAKRQIDRVPLHRLGLRMEVDEMRDGGVGVNGFFVVR